jgi:hypothetical protein
MFDRSLKAIYDNSQIAPKQLYKKEEHQAIIILFCQLFSTEVLNFRLNGIPSSPIKF